MVGGGTRQWWITWSRWGQVGRSLHRDRTAEAKITILILGLFTGILLSFLAIHSLAYVFKYKMTRGAKSTGRIDFFDILAVPSHAPHCGGVGKVRKNLKAGFPLGSCEGISEKCL